MRKPLKTQNSLIKARPTTLTQWAMKPTCFAQINTKISTLSQEIIIYIGRSADVVLPDQ